MIGRLIGLISPLTGIADRLARAARVLKFSRRMILAIFFITVGAIVKIQLLKFLRWLKNLNFLFNVLAFLKLSITTYLILTVRLVLVRLQNM